MKLSIILFCSNMDFIQPDVVSMLILTTDVKTCIADNRSPLRCPATLNHFDIPKILDDLTKTKQLMMKVSIATMAALVSTARNFELRDSSGEYRNFTACVNYAKRISDNIQQIVEMINAPCSNWERPNHPFKVKPELRRAIMQLALALGLAMEMPNME